MYHISERELMAFAII